MKQIILAFCLLLCCATFAQKSKLESLKTPTPTTDEEYNYMTKGYKIQIESGLDMKKGYEFIDFNKKTIDNKYSFITKLLIRTKDKSLAGLLVIVNSKVSGNTYYNCIPINNNDLFNKFKEKLYNYDPPLLKAFSLLMAENSIGGAFYANEIINN